MNIPGYDLHNHLWSELQIGDEASIDHTITARDLYLFAYASGNLNPNHMPYLDVAQEGSQEGAALKLKDLEKLTEEIKHWCLYSGDKPEKLGKNLSDN